MSATVVKINDEVVFDVADQDKSKGVIVIGVDEVGDGQYEANLKANASMGMIKAAIDTLEKLVQKHHQEQFKKVDEMFPGIPPEIKSMFAGIAMAMAKEGFGISDVGIGGIGLICQKCEKPGYCKNDHEADEAWEACQPVTETAAFSGENIYPA